MKQPPDLNLGRRALDSFLKQRSPLGPLRVMFEHLGGFFQIPLPGFKPYIVAGPEANRKVLVTERDKLLWRNHDPVTDLLRHGVLVTDGEEHDRYRALMEPSLHPGGLNGHAQMMREKTDQVTSAWKNGQVLDMLVESRVIALLIIMQALFSVDAWNDLQRIWTPILKAIQFISPGTWILWRKIPRPGYRRHLKTLDAYLYRIIRERRAAPGKADLLQHLIDAGLDDGTIRDQMLTMLIAGHDTSTALLAWVFVLLGQHPQVHQQLAADLKSEDRPPLLDQVIKETLRLYPPIHIGNRLVADDLEFEAGTVPAGARMFYSIYLTQRDPSIWEHADEFQPARFERGRKTPPFSYVPFGGGPRACIGAAFGQYEARLVLSQLLRHFEFTPLNVHKIHPHMGATLEPRHGVFMQVRFKSEEED